MPTINQSVRPSTAAVNADGHLEIGGCDATFLAKEFGTPLYVYDEASIRGMCRSYREALGKYAGKAQPLFASKAFCSAALYGILQEEGFGLDCVSGGELFTAGKAGFPMDKVLFNGNNKSEEELSLAFDLNIGRFSVDNFDELPVLNAVAKKKGKKAAILLRVAPGISAHTHEAIRTGQTDSKFGFNLGDLTDAVRQIKEKYPSLELKGLHAHIGSQIFELTAFHDLAFIMAETAANLREKTGFVCEEMDFGGGLGVRYVESDDPPSVFELMGAVTDGVTEAFGKFGLPLPLLYVEPGRSIVATAGVTLYTVGTFKEVPGVRTYAAIDGGMGDNPRPALYGSAYTFAVANKMSEAPSKTYTIAGRYCESGDVLVKDYALPPMQRGDVLAVFCTGAYGASMFLDYNRVGKPAAVLVKEGKANLILRRPTYEELASYDQSI